MSTTADSESKPVTLWRHGGFLRLWGGETASQFGEQLGNLAIPVLAVTILGATDFQVGLLAAAGTAAFLIVGLPAGAWIDRMLKRKVMIAADVVRTIAMGAVPLLWLVGWLNIWWLIVIATVVGVATVFFDVSYQSYVPVLVDRRQIPEANSKLETTAQLAHIAGPALAGALLTVIKAPFVLAVTSFTYLTSFLFLLTIHDDEVQRPKEQNRPLWTEIREGAAFVWNEPLLRRIVACTSGTNFFNNISFTVLPILILRDLDLGPAVFGIAASIGSIGGLIGAVLSARIGRWIGEGTAIPVSAIVGGVAAIVIALMPVFPVAAIPLLAVGMFMTSFAVLVYNITQVSFRQRICPPALLGRMNASIRFVVWGVMPIAGIVAGLISTALGSAATFWIGAVGSLLAAGFVVFSPLMGMRTLPDMATTSSSAGVGE